MVRLRPPKPPKPDTYRIVVTSPGAPSRIWAQGYSSKQRADAAAAKLRIEMAPRMFYVQLEHEGSDKLLPDSNR